MKHVILLCISLIALASIAQTCKVSGSINNPSIKEVYLYLLEGENYFVSPSLKLRVSSKGTFNTQVNVTTPVFARLIAGNKGQRLLLSAGRDVHITFDTTGNIENVVTGKGAPESILSNNSVLRNAPAFINRKWTPDELTTANWHKTIMQPVELDIDATTRQIQRLNIPASLKKILTSELYYAYQCYLYDFAADHLRWSKHPNNRSFLDSAIQWRSLPDSQSVISGFYANMMLDRHVRYIANSFFNKDDRKKARAEWASYLKMPFDSIYNLVKTYGETVAMGWQYAKHYMPVSLRDRILYNYLNEAANEGSLNICNYVYNILQQNFPKSPYAAKVKITMQHLKQTIKSNTNNSHIVFNDASGIQSLSQLVAPYKGNVVYLDMWGTWCGACKEEMTYVPEMKEKFAGKDIVFLYLSNDDDSKDNKWKDQVYHAGLEGEHYRMDNKAIERIWESVKEAGGRTGYYPTYILIDKDGKIITPNANRPSSREKLYAQLDKVL